MDPVKRDRRPKSSTDSLRPPDPAAPQGETRNASPLRVDECCPQRYYPLFPLAARRKTPIRYYE
jgi:hypothetical protein